MEPTPLSLQTRGGTIGLVDRGLQPVLGRLGGATGILNLFLQTPGCALSVNENADPSVRVDMLAALERLAPGPGAEAAETKALLYQKSLNLPVVDGRIPFGTWQGVYLASLGQDASAEVTATFVPGAVMDSFTFSANRRASHALDDHLQKGLASKGGSGPGVLMVHEKHTSASLSVAKGDLEPGMSAIIPEKWNREFFTHTMEGDDDMPGHLKCSLLGCNQTLPVSDGQLCLGEGQQVLLNEHRDAGGWGGGHSRSVVSVLVPAVGLWGFAASGPVQDITRQVQEAVSAQDGLATVFVQDPGAGLAVCSAEAAEALARCGALAVDPLCGPAILGCSTSVPVSKGKLLLASGTGLFLLGGGPSSKILVASSSSAAAAAQ